MDAHPRAIALARPLQRTTGRLCQRAAVSESGHAPLNTGELLLLQSRLLTPPVAVSLQDAKKERRAPPLLRFTVVVTRSLLLHHRERDHVPDRRAVREQHHQPVHPDPEPRRRRHPVLERRHEVLVHLDVVLELIRRLLRRVGPVRRRARRRRGLHRGVHGDLRLEALPLVHWVRQLAEGVGQLAAWEAGGRGPRPLTHNRVARRGRAPRGRGPRGWRRGLTVDEELEALGDARDAAVGLGERRDVERVVQDERGLDL